MALASNAHFKGKHETPGPLALFPLAARAAPNPPGSGAAGSGGTIDNCPPRPCQPLGWAKRPGPLHRSCWCPRAAHQGSLGPSQSHIQHSGTPPLKPLIPPSSPNLCSILTTPHEVGWDGDGDGTGRAPPGQGCSGLGTRHCPALPGESRLPQPPWVLSTAPNPALFPVVLCATPSVGQSSPWGRCLRALQHLWVPGGGSGARSPVLTGLIGGLSSVLGGPSPRHSSVIIGPSPSSAAAAAAFAL